MILSFSYMILFHYRLRRFGGLAALVSPLLADGVTRQVRCSMRGGRA